MKLLNKNKLSIYPDDILVGEIYNGVIVESSNIEDKLFQERTMVYESIDSSVESYYKLNNGSINLTTDSTVIEFIVEADDIKLKETHISDITFGSLLCDSAVIQELESKKEQLLEIGFLSEAIEQYKALHGYGDEFVLPLPVFVTDIELVEEITESKEIEFENTNPMEDRVGIIFIDNVAVKVD